MARNENTVPHWLASVIPEDVNDLQVGNSPV